MTSVVITQKQFAQIKKALELAREALSYTGTDLTDENFAYEEAALVAIDFALESL